MKKKMLTCLMAITCVFMLAACGKKKEDITVDMNTLVSDLSATVTSDTLANVSSDIMASTYFFDTEKIDESVGAMGSGASACEVAVVKCKDADYAKDVADLFKTRVKNQTDLFSSYNAQEVEKLNAAIIENTGNYAVLCVTDDTSAAKEILEKAGF